MRGIKDIYVVGRKNPDLDSVASSIAYAELKNTIDRESNYVPTICGNTDKITQKLFGFYNVPLPKYIDDLSIRVEDVMTKNAIKVNKNESVTEIFRLMLKNDLIVAPVVDDDDRFIGYFGMTDIARKSISSVMPDIFRKIKTSIEIIRKAVDGEMLVNSENDKKMFVATIVMGVMDEDGLMKVIERIEPENIIMVVGNRKDFQKAAIEMGIKCLVISHGYKMDNELIELAKNNGVAVISSEYDAFATVGLIEWSIPVETICEKSDAVVHPSDLISEIKEKVYRSSNRAVAVVNSSKKVVGILTRTDIIKYDRRSVILIDHSSSLNAPEGIFECNILEIIDHHRLGDIQTGFPTRYRIEPWGATATIVADEFKVNGIKPSKTTALLLASAIIVNTNFLKVNVTHKDEQMLNWLCDSWDCDRESVYDNIKAAINL